MSAVNLFEQQALLENKLLRPAVVDDQFADAPSPDIQDTLSEAIGLLGRVHHICRNIQLPDKFSGDAKEQLAKALRYNEASTHKVLNNLAAIRMHVHAARRGD